MKKFILVLSALCFTVVTLKAQTKQIVRSDYAYAGGRFEMADDTSYTLPAAFAEGGQNKSWDLSNLVAHEQYVTKFAAPGSANGGDTVDGCNLVMQDDENEEYYTYLKITDTSLVMVSVPGEDPMFEGPGEWPLLMFPAKFGTTWSSNYTTQSTYSGDEFGVPVDSIRFTIVADANAMVDADGTLKLPVGTKDVIRIKMISNINVKTSVFNEFTGWMDVNEEDNEMISYQFFSPGGGAVIANIQTEADQDEAYVSFRASSLTPTKEIAGGVHKYTVYPNPSVGSVVKVAGSISCTVTVFDQTGRVVKVLNDINDHSNTIDINDLPNGLYYFRIIGDDGSVQTEKVVKS